MATDKDEEEDIDKCVNNVVQFCGKLYRYPELYGQLLEVLQSFQINPVGGLKQISNLLQFDGTLRNEFFALLPGSLAKQFVESGASVRSNEQEVTYVHDASERLVAECSHASSSVSIPEEQCPVSVVIGSDFVDVVKEAGMSSNKRRMVLADTELAGEPSSKIRVKYLLLYLMYLLAK